MADRGAIEGYLIDKFLNVDFEGIQVLDLSFGEIRSHERLSPMKSSEGLEFTRECSQCAPSVVKMPLPDSGPKVKSMLTQSKIIKICCKDCLDVFRIDGVDENATHCGSRPSRAMFFIPFHRGLE